ncbi:MAG: TonB-dependent receptor [Pseudorhodoferax sp.]
MRWRLPGQAQLTLGYEHFQDRRTDDRGIPSWNGRPLATDRATFFGNPDESFTWVRLNALNAQLALDLGDGLRLQSRLRHADYDKFFQNVFAGGVRENAGQREVALLAHNSRMRRQNTASQTELGWSWDQGALQHQLLAGIELSRQAGDNWRETGFFANGATTLYVPVSQPTLDVPLTWRSRPGDPSSRSAARQLALYLQDKVRLAPDWQATLGLRHDSLSVDMQDIAQSRALSSRDRLWSPRAALLWQPREALSLYLGGSVGYAPRAGEQLIGLNPASQALRPEKFVNHETRRQMAPPRRPGSQRRALPAGPPPCERDGHGHQHPDADRRPAHTRPGAGPVGQLAARLAAHGRLRLAGQPRARHAIAGRAGRRRHAARAAPQPFRCGTAWR